MPGDSGNGELEGVSGQSQSRRETLDLRRQVFTVATRLRHIAEQARQEPRSKFGNIAYLLNEGFLTECFRSLRKQAAAGIDGVTWEEYSKNLMENLANLVRRMKAWQYRPQPVRRVYIPKDKKSKRPLGIPALEDKIVQEGMRRILEAIFEGDFLDGSYGFRRGRGCHQALQTLDETIQRQPVSYVVEADIKGYFDSVDHELLLRALRERVSDENFLRLVVRFLKAGVMEEEKRWVSEEGTPQGGILSPLLSNIFLHYVLDRWFERKVKPTLRGFAQLNRYADDFVFTVQYREEAELILQKVEQRFAACKLSLSPEKTRVVEFGRFAEERTARRGQRPGTYDYLGFTHYCGKTRRGKFKVGRQTSRKKLRQKLTAMNAWLKAVRNRAPLREWWSLLRQKLLGHYHYYGVSGNFRRIHWFFRETYRLALKWLNRRSQKKSYTYERFAQYLQRYPLPKPKIYHNFYEPRLVW